jgi:hypothetical protein
MMSLSRIKWNKRVTFVFLLILLAFIAHSQTNHVHTGLLSTRSSAISFQNNFFQDANNIKYMPYDIKTPFKDLYFIVFGSRLKLSAYNVDELMKGEGWVISGWFRDTTKNDAPIFDLQTLEYAIVKSSPVDVTWQKAIHKPCIDTSANNYSRGNKIYYRKGYLLYDGHLSNGDSLSLLLRKGKGQPFLKIHFTKRSALESPPQLTGYMDNHDPELPLEKFVQKALESYRSSNMEFYEDWPGRNDRSNVKLFPDTKVAYYFNPRGTTSHDSAFEYRLVVDNAVPQWKKSNNIIFVSGLKAGKQYQLQVRQTNKPQYIFTKRFYVPGNWYQTVWFKLLLAFLLLLASLTLYLLIKTRRQKRIQQEGKSKMRSLYAQLNPHFIFNAMGSIQGLLNENELEKANRYLAGFGHLLRTTLNSSEKDSISLKEELENISTYISLEQLRRPFQFTENIGDGVIPANIEMLPLFFQPVIENAIKHGAAENKTLQLLFSITRQAQDLHVRIEDDGKGFNTKASYNGKGLELLKERIRLFNQISKNKKIVQELSSNAAGTVIQLKFINWLDHD